MSFLFSVFRVVRLAARIVRVITMGIAVAGAVRRYAA